MKSRIIMALAIITSIYQTPLQAFQNGDHLEMEITFNKNVLEVSASISFINLYDGADSAMLILNPALQLKQIDGEFYESNGMGMVLGRPFPFRKIKFSKSFEKGEQVNLKMSYDINLSQFNFIDEGWLELNVDQLWFPNYNDLDHTFTSNVKINNLYEDWSIVSCCGNELTENSDGSLQLVVNKALPSVFIIGGKNMVYYNSDPENVGLKFWASENVGEEDIKRQYDAAATSIKYFNQSFGKQQPLKDMTIALRGTEKLNYIFCRQNLVVSNPSVTGYSSLAHEISHHWWDKADFINEPWLNESFAQYSMLLVLEKYDSEYYKKRLNAFEGTLNTLPAVGSANNFDPKQGEAIYNKGPYLLKLLEEKIGMEKMIEVLNLRVSKNLNTTLAFLDGLEEVTDKETRLFFENLLSK